jgi:NTP pyrophosphatase (non-canonical NTP hydrolase)
LNIDEFQEVNAKRATKWHKKGLQDWSLLEWAGAMCGEAGEAANNAKKIRRLDMDLPNKEAGIDSSDMVKLKMKLATEVADTIIYGLIILSMLNVVASEELADVFDKKSEEYGFPERAPRA